MELLGAGIDLVRVTRVERMISRWGDRFLNRVFTPLELSQAQGAHAARRLAGRLAVKEAALKAMGTGLRACRWIHMEVTNDPLGRPLLALNGELEETAGNRGISSFLVSVTYEGDLAVAQVLAVGWRLPG
jgi:holo-[acyl-carrier protein] synthase